ncbi:MAG: DUF2326 domain-containing protein [Colwellia sp.]
MQLHKLNVLKNKELLREVQFKIGLNLILNSDSKSAKSGNSVGKSTPSRLIDYLFLSSGEDIYTEPEFEKTIPEVANFLNNNDILIELEFISFDGKPYVISRDLKTNLKDALYYINRESVDSKIYKELVASKIFGQQSDKPSVRNLSHKFIRNTNEKMQNTTRFLHLNSKPDVYDQVYLFLFGFTGLELLKEKASINNQVSTKRKHLAAYRKPHKESSLIKMIKPLEAEASLLKQKISEFDFKDNQETNVKELVSVQSEISDLTLIYSGLENKINYLNKSICNLKSSATRVNGRELSDIYSEAGIAISGELKRSYEELVVFHNKVLSNKVKLIESELLSVESGSASVRLDINVMQEKEASVFKNINEPDTLKSIGRMYNDLSTIRENIASTSALLKKIEDTKETIELLESTKAKVVDKINNNTVELDSNTELFNQYFGDLSKSFYDERYIFDLNFNLEKEKCEFDIACISPNSTGGKKKGELSAFDLAYISFINEKKLKRPTFVIHDSIEDVDVNQVFDIFQNANRSNGQYIVAVLSDKLTGKEFDVFKRDSVVLELSETNKFFKI